MRLLQQLLDVFEVHLFVNLLQDFTPRLESVHHRHLHEGELDGRNLCIIQGSVSSVTGVLEVDGPVVRVVPIEHPFWLVGFPGTFVVVKR